MDIILDKCQGESLLAQRNFILNETISLDRRTITHRR